MRIFAGFAILFLALFAQFPLTGSLPGNADTQLAIALSNQILEKLRLLFTGNFGDPTVLYPSRDVLAYGENCYGLAAMFLVFEVLTRDEIWGYYFFLTTIFALNGYAVTKLASLFTPRLEWAVLAGVVFTLSGFTLGNVDDPNVVFAFFPVMSLMFLLKGSREGNPRAWILGFLFAGLQIWFGFYLFVYQFAILFGYVLYEWKSFRAVMAWAQVKKAAMALLVPMAPLMILYVYNHENASIVSPYEVFRDCSLGFQDFMQHLPDNLIYSIDHRWLDWVEIRKNCFPGISMPIVAAAGVFAWVKSGRSWQKKTLFFLTLVFAVFLFFSFGANNPLLTHFRDVPWITYLRVPSRFYLVCVLILGVFFAVGASWIFDRKLKTTSAKSIGVALALAVVFIVENVPFPLFGYEYASIMRPPEETVEYFAKQPEQSVLLDLPSTIEFLPSQSVNTADRLWFFTREIIYMNWQTYHRQMIVGGANGYVSKTRADVESWVRKLPHRDSIVSLKALGVSHVVFHKEMVLFPDENILEGLKASPELKLALESEREAIFEIVL